MNAGREMPIFSRSFDLLQWPMQATNHFPRAYRHDFTHRLLDAAFDLRESLEQANLRRGRARAEWLASADEALARVRLYVRLANELGWLNAGQYAHVAKMLAEVGRRHASQCRAPDFARNSMRLDCVVCQRGIVTRRWFTRVCLPG